MKVKCIDNDDGNYNLTINKIYNVEDELENMYMIYDDNGRRTNFYKIRFTVVEDKNSIRVRCIDNAGGSFRLTIGKEYEVLSTSSNNIMYEIRNDTGERLFFNKTRFEKLNCKSHVDNSIWKHHIIMN